MICEWALRVDIRKLGQALPKHLPVYGELIRTTTTPCHLGGLRYWFLCPSCDRRCAILYPHQCRKCVNGRYRVELMTPHRRKITKAIKLRARLGQTSGGTVAPFPHKPARMRWQTYSRLRAEIEALETEIWATEWARLFG